MNRLEFETHKITYNDSISISFLYNTVPGRVLLRFITKGIFSRFFGVLMDSGISKSYIPFFVKKNDIDMNDYKRVKYTSFNDFFSREIKDGLRPLSPNAHDVIAPCDAKLSAYRITTGSVFKIKKSLYNIRGLLGEKGLANKFADGVCLIFRLTPDDYHRYCYIDDGKVVFRKKIKGILHTVRPIVMEKQDIYVQNSREYALLQTKNFGMVIQMEVGALLVGRIINHNASKHFKRGEAKGTFEFGGSTIILLFQKNSVTIDNNIFENTRQDKETVVKMGNRIGHRMVIK